MPNWEINLRTGVKTYPLDLAELPFQSRLGAAEGEMRLTSDREGHPEAVRVLQTVPKRFLAEQLDRIASEASWPVPVEELRSLPAERLVVELALRPEFLRELETLQLEDPMLAVRAGWYPALMDERNYAVEDIRAEEAPR